MVTFLLDTSVLFVGLNRAHEGNEVVSRWLAAVDRYATCGMTQIGVFRLFLNPTTMNGKPVKPDIAHSLVADLVRDERHTFVDCPAISRELVGKTSGHKAAVDDYLVQVADAAGCRLATLDRRLAIRLPGHTLLIE